MRDELKVSALRPALTAVWCGKEERSVFILAIHAP